MNDPSRMQPFEPLALAGTVKANAHIPNTMATSRFMFISYHYLELGNQERSPLVPSALG